MNLAEQTATIVETCKWFNSMLADLQQRIANASVNEYPELIEELEALKGRAEREIREIDRIIAAHE